MAQPSWLPRSIQIERKEFVIDWDKIIEVTHVCLSEIEAHKSFSVILYPDSIDWLRKFFDTLLKIPRNNKFFQEKRYDTYILCIEKTFNKKGYLAEIYRLDEKGRKCCIMIPEGIERR